jgi:hypothetical protein
MSSRIGVRRAAFAAVAALLAVLALAPAALAHAGGADEVDVPHGDPRSGLPDALVTETVARAEMGAIEPATLAATTPGLPESWCGDPDPTADNTANAVVPSTTAHFKLVYAHASDQANRFADWSNRLQATASLLDRYVATASGGRKTLRWDVGTSCALNPGQYVDIQVVHLPNPLSHYNGDANARFDRLDTDVRAAIGAGARGSGSGPRNIVIWADGFFQSQNGIAGQGSVYRGACCGGTSPDSPSFPYHDLGGLTAVVYGPQVAPSDGYAWPGPMLHEMTHNMGAVQDSAPHTSGVGHCDDRYDVMCYPDGGASYQETRPCALLSGQAIPDTYDCGGDDYFNPAPPSGSYLANHWNVYDAAHLAPCSELPLACGVADEGDPGAPSNTTPVAPPGWRRTGYSVTLSGTSTSAPVDGFQWRVDGGAVQTTRTATVNGAGIHTLETRVGDSGGNWSGWRSEVVRIDLTDPVASLDCTNGWQRANATCTASATDAGGSGVQTLVWADGGGTPRTIASGASFTVSGHGVHTIKVTATDGAGGTGTATDLALVDLTAPVVSATCPAGWTTRAEDCRFEAIDPETGVTERRIRVDGGVARVLTGAQVPVEFDGAHTVELIAVNGAGATATSAPATLRLDLDAPAVSLSCTPLGGGRHSCVARAADTGSGVATLTAAGAARTPGGAFEVECPMSFSASATDRVGRNASSPVVRVAGADGATSGTPAAGPSPRSGPAARRRASATAKVRRRGRMYARGSVVLVEDGATRTASVALRPARLAAGRWRLRVCAAGAPCITKTVRLRRAGTPAALRVPVAGAAARVRATFQVFRGAGRRYRLAASGAAVATLR